MKRDLAKLANREYDLLVIGGGIYGACVAWDAALRGLSVALVEKGDFGGATSSNSLKIVHGGLRYLQDANLKLVRTMVRERSAFMQIAPHLVQPLPFLMPTYGRGLSSREVMALALRITDFVGIDRNSQENPHGFVPHSRIVSRRECLELAPGVWEEGLTGGAIWHDAQVYNSERLTLSFLLSADEEGAAVANYVEVTGFLKAGDRLVGAEAKDVLSGQKLEIRARQLVNAAGPWVDSVLSLVGGGTPGDKFRPSMAMNLVTRQLHSDMALGVFNPQARRRRRVNGSDRSRVYFIVPWRGFSLIGTTHASYNGPCGDLKVTEKDMQRFVRGVNDAFPAAGLSMTDVHFVHRGLLPIIKGRRGGESLRLLRHGRVHDHEREDGLRGLISLVGVKYTTARSEAQKAVDLVFRKLGKRPPQCLTRVTPIYGGKIDRFGDYLAQEAKELSPRLSRQVVQKLAHSYGSRYREVLTYIEEDPSWAEPVCAGSNVLKAMVVHAVREEMAQRLGDVLLRRTDLGSAGDPGGECAETCARIMAQEGGWDESKTQRELAAVTSFFNSRSYAG